MDGTVVMDSDVQAVAEFMQERIAASRLVAVADGLGAVAPLLWGQYQPEAVQALRLVSAPPISGDGPRTQSIASGSVPDYGRADGDSVAVAVGLR